MIKEVTPNQAKLLGLFYGLPATKVVYMKQERDDFWKRASKKKAIANFREIEEKNPALAHQIEKSNTERKNIQSAVFSECAYAQTLANMMSLTKFANCLENDFSSIPRNVQKILNENNLIPRYVYANKELTRLLIQAGGCGGVDSALISVAGSEVYTIEYKEPGAKTSEPDLPRYGEDGKMVVNSNFLAKYPQFKAMLDEHKDLNFFKAMGSNIHDFSDESIITAVSDNYVKKHADVICTEDKNGYLTMIPGDQIPLWAHLEGEIRPAGRNHHDVWTPKALRRFLEEEGANIVGDKVTIPVSRLRPRIQRGGNGKISGYKINSLFYVKIEDCNLIARNLVFELSKAQQLNPTIAGKMFFRDLDYNKVKAYYCA